VESSNLMDGGPLEELVVPWVTVRPGLLLAISVSALPDS
jgi:hypothetical protein